MKNIFESRLFWERISSFFEIMVRHSEMEQLNSFYNMPVNEILSKLQLPKNLQSLETNSL